MYVLTDSSCHTTQVFDPALVPFDAQFCDLFLMNASVLQDGWIAKSNFRIQLRTHVPKF
jgi:hypothetical protein